MSESEAIAGHILVVASQPADIELLTTILTGGGYQVTSTLSGQSAVETVRESPPDLILLDIHAPDMDEHELCRQLRAVETTCDTPVIFVEPEDKASVFAAGGADYVTRPLLKEEVLARVETHMALHTMQNQLAERDARLERAITERIQAEEALQVAEEQGRDLIENLSDVIYSVDGDGILTYVSPAIEPFLGHSPSEITGRHFSEFIYQEDLARPEGAFRRILSGHSASNEYQVVTKSGEIRWMRTSSQPVFDGDRVAGAQGVLADITETKQAEERIRQQNEFLTKVLESLTHPFYVLNANDYTIEIANPAAVADSQSESTTCYALTHGLNEPCDTASHPCPLEEIKRTGKPVMVEHIHFDREGRARDVEVHGYPLFDEEGNVVRVIEYSLDITERKRVDEALRDSEEKWRSLTEYSPDHIMLLDREADILFINHTLPGLSREQVIGTSFHDYALPEYKRVAQVCFEQVLETGRPDRFESTYMDARGRSSTFESYVGPVMRSGEIWGLTVRNTDITAAKQAETALQRMTHELGERVKELNCLHGVSRLAGRQDISLDEIFQGAVDLLPPAFQHPEVTCARIVREGQEFTTQNFRETTWRLASDLFVYGEQVGALEVCYLESRPEEDEGPFLVEEKNLIDVVAEHLGRISERRRAEQALREAKEAAEAARSEERIRRREAERRRQIAEGLADIVAALNSNQALDQILHQIVLQARQLLDNQAVAIYRLQREDGTLALQTAQGLPDDYLADVDTPPGQQALRQAVTSGHPATVSDLAVAAAEEGILALDRARPTPSTPSAKLYRALLAAPIVVKEEVYGGIMLYYTKPRAFSDEEVELAAVFSDQVALAIENARLREQLQLAAASAERSRLARDLHDSVTQALFSATLVAEVLPQVWQRDPEEALLGLEELRQLTRGALSEMRTMLLELRPSALVETRLDDLLQQLTEAVTGRVQLQVTLDLEPIPAVPPDVHITFYRVAQEALHNVVKHAHASRVIVSLRASPPSPSPEADTWQGQVILHVSDDGQGFEPSHIGADQLGLDIMHERVKTVGALLTIDSQPGQGSRVTLVWQNR